ncbi:MAG TPA: Nif3-like dinuclear metal center hexameric protein [Chloroflexota bacterium]|jgi:dinuclear metal center YbgI/SA1388 family protein|nr:Nif3-like dinuclear metal center hexameric protein [Chloroflexota bacterium]
MSDGVGRDELAAFMADYLQVERCRDVAPNGLQVPGAERVRHLILGVSASLQLFRRAAAAGAQAVLVHHGLFWERQPRSIDPLLKARLAVLFDADLSLFAYHIPLDRHREVGNNVQLVRRLGLELGDRPFGRYDGDWIGAVGLAPDGLELTALASRLAALTGGAAVVHAHGPERVRTVGVVSGGAAGSFAEAIAAGLDVFVTGEVAEPTQAIARETGANFVAIGHYNSEKFGVLALGDLLAARFGLTTEFVDLPNAA